MGRSKRNRTPLARVPASVAASFQSGLAALSGEDPLVETLSLQQSAEDGSATSKTGKEYGTASDEFSQVEIFFQLEAEKRRSGSLFPRDIGNLLLWSVPSAVPLIECPRVFFLKNKSRLRDVVMIYVNGWTHGDMIFSGVSTGTSVATLPAPMHSNSPHSDRQYDDNTLLTPSNKRQRLEGVAEDNGVGRVDKLCWAERIGLAMLSPIRAQKCWSRPECGVQFSPMFLPESKCTLEEEIFWRNDAPKSFGGCKRHGHSTPSDHSVAGTAEAANCSGANGVMVATSADPPPGVRSLFQRALDINGSSASNPTFHTTNDCAVAKKENTTTVRSPPLAHDRASLWDDRDTLFLHALSMRKHRGVMERLFYTLEIPTDVSASEWTTFESPPTVPCNRSSVAPSPSVFALDCEMVKVLNGVSALARVTLVDVRRSTVVYDTLVKPTEEVIDYVTQFSGIDEAMLKSVKTTLQDCQRELKRFINTETFVVGHSLENDFKACKILPNCYVLDSAHLFPHPSGLPRKNALRFLASRYLNKKIQQGSHNSAEDAFISAELVYLKLQNGPQFGIRSRVSLLGIMEDAVVEMREDSKVLSPTVELHLFDDPRVLRDIVPSASGKKATNGIQSDGGSDCVGGTNNHSVTRKTLVDTVPVRHDEDAVRKVVRCLQERKSIQQNTRDKSLSSYSFTWLQLTDTVVRSGTMQQDSEEPRRSWEELQFECVKDTNRRVLQVIHAAPHNSLVFIIVAADADCIEMRNTNKPISSTPQGVCFAFVKDEKATGPAAEWLNTGETVRCDSSVAIPPACKQQ